MNIEEDQDLEKPILDGAEPGEDEDSLPGDLENEDIFDEEEIAEKGEESEDESEDEEPPKKELYKVKVDGEEQEVALEELLRGYAHNTAANKRFQEAAELRKQYESTVNGYKKFFESLGQSPLQTLAEIPELREVLESDIKSYLAEVIRREQMTEEERRAHDLEKEIQEREAYFRELEEKKTKAEQEYENNRFKNELSSWVSEEAVNFKTPQEKQLFKVNLEATAARLHGQGALLTQEHVKKVAESTHELIRGFAPKTPEGPPTKIPVPGGKTSTQKGSNFKTPKREPVDFYNFFDSLRRDF